MDGPAAGCRGWCRHSPTDAVRLLLGQSAAAGGILSPATLRRVAFRKSALFSFLSRGYVPCVLRPSFVFPLKTLPHVLQVDGCCTLILARSIVSDYLAFCFLELGLTHGARVERWRVVKPIRLSFLQLCNLCVWIFTAEGH